MFFFTYLSGRQTSYHIEPGDRTGWRQTDEFCSFSLICLAVKRWPSDFFPPKTRRVDFYCRFLSANTILFLSNTTSINTTMKDPLPVPDQLERQLSKCKTVRDADTYCVSRMKTAEVRKPVRERHRRPPQRSWKLLLVWIWMFRGFFNVNAWVVCRGVLGDMGGHLIGVVVERAHALYLERELQSNMLCCGGCECIFVTFYSISLSLSLNLLHIMWISDLTILIRKLQRQWRVERQTILSSRRHRLLELSSRDDDD